MNSLISLVLMMKNESRSIASMIEQAASGVDRVDLLDTGSVDGTMELAQQACALKNLPFSSSREPFADFATSRNRSLEIAAPHAVFGLQLSGDEYLYGAETLRSFCEARRASSDLRHEIAYIQVRVGDTVHRAPRLVRLSSPWRWVGAVHEAMQRGTETIEPIEDLPADSCWIEHRDYDPERKRSRYYWDLEVLLEQYRKNPKDPRTVFYLAQTLEGLELYAEAARRYMERANINEGWNEEQFIAVCRAGVNMHRAGHPHHEVMRAFLAATGLRPWRAEPMISMAQLFIEHGLPGTAYFYAKNAARLPLPIQDSFGVETDLYDWKARYYIAMTAHAVGFYQEGLDATISMLERDPATLPCSVEQLQQNLALYKLHMASPFVSSPENV